MGKELKADVLKRRIKKQDPEWSDLDLSEFDNITLESAELIADAEGAVDLGGLATISDEIATVLARHKGTLHLEGLTEISEGAAKAFYKFDGWLTLGMAYVGDEAAMALSKSKASLKLINLKQLDATEGHISLAKKLVADDTHDILYMLEKVAKEVNAAVPEFPKV